LRSDEERYLLSKERGFLATVNDDGTPTLVPICFAYREGVLYTAVNAKPKSKHLARTKNIRKRHRVAFIVDTYSKDWRRLSYLLIHGRAEFVVSARERNLATTLLVKKYHQYRWLRRSMMAIIKITVEKTKLWKFKS
jgi:PPOX class probable F420-dependent enzyme